MNRAQLETMIALLESDIELENHMIQYNKELLTTEQDWANAYSKGIISTREETVKTLERRVNLLKSWRGAEQDGSFRLTI
ncbi:hypothetical protein ACFFJY_09080 [Fictibacillus aquaticus]|uniref:Uncharacterized protein n=1 Tax=Fictibacillus aquaticus TaxID=2021314 RepID=A0A235FAT2_9BACL|nr:hypothetical protein [Fictibacillus aquaticus]OYD58436.1 hypothetical protein CGZ90_00600 [Fictibacillus aquaticus]